MGLFMLIATWKGTVMIVGALAIALMSGCSNRRFYIGMDDYGDTVKMHNSWETDGGDRARK